MYRYFIIFLSLIAVNCQNPEVEIPQGKLIGRTRTNRDGGSFYSFQRIPYGKPPIGELRFKLPELAEPWKGTLDATEDLPLCLQSENIGGSDITGQEDCLYLNLYTPGLSAENITDLPVMVFIFGGGFLIGDALETSYGPDFLLTKDVILVVPNYRLGVFGFLTLDDPTLGVTGNAGLKDQVLALKWIQENIQYFGGNPNNVLIFGQSAGGQSVHRLVLSPMADGLFHKAIAESGAALKITNQYRNSALIVAETLGIQTDNYAEMIKTLQDMDSLELAEGTKELLAKRLYFNPIVEIPAEDTFLQEQPIDIIRSGNYNHVYFMIGYNDAEAKGELEIIEDFTEYIPPEFGIDSESELAASIATSIKVQYFGDEEPTTENLAPTIYLETDYASGFPAYRSAVEHIKTALMPIYFYIFGVDTTLNLSYGKTNFPGAAHSDELGYLFSSTATPDYIEAGSVEDLAWRNMVNLWTNFAIYGTPTPEGFDYIVEPATEEQFNYLDIATAETTAKINPEEEHFQFWMGLYEEYSPYYKKK